MRTLTETMDDRIFLAIMLLAGTVIGAVAIVAIVMAASAVDSSISGPEQTAEEHIRDNIEEIRGMAERTTDDGMPILEEAVIHCWEEKNPWVVPSDRYNAQRCRISFGARPQGDVTAVYTVIMKHRRWNPWAILRSPNHPIEDAYLEQDTVRAYPENRHIRLGGR